MERYLYREVYLFIQQIPIYWKPRFIYLQRDIYFYWID